MLFRQLLRTSTIFSDSPQSSVRLIQDYQKPDKVHLQESDVFNALSVLSVVDTAISDIGLTQEQILEIKAIISDISNLVTQDELAAVKALIPDASKFATTAQLLEVKALIPNTSDFVTRTTLQESLSSTTATIQSWANNRFALITDLAFTNAALSGNTISIQNNTASLNLINNKLVGINTTVTSYVTDTVEEAINNLDITIFIPVTALPAEGRTNKIYLVPITVGTDTNRWEEWIWAQKPNTTVYAWERIGSITMDVDPTEFVKKAGDTMTGPLVVNSTIKSTGTITSGAYLYTNGKTSANDGLAGSYIGSGAITITSSVNPIINFYYGGATSVSAYISCGGSNALSVNATISPATSNAYTLGKDTNRWSNVYSNLLNTLGNATIGGNVLTTGYIFVGGKTSHTDGISGGYLGAGELRITSAASTSVYMRFYYGGATTYTHYIAGTSGNSYSVYGHWTPTSNATWNQGSINYRWNDIYSVTLNTRDSITSGADVYTYGKTSPTDGKGGIVLGGSNIYMTSAAATSGSISFYYNSATVPTHAIRYLADSEFNIQGHWHPQTTNIYNIGTDLLRWSTIFGVIGNFSSNVTVGGGLTVAGAATVAGHMKVGSGLEVTGDIRITNGKIYIDGVSLDGRDIEIDTADFVMVMGDQTINGNKTFTGASIFNTIAAVGITIDGKPIATKEYVDGLISSGTGSTGNYVTLDTDQTITGIKTFAGQITANKGLVISGTNHYFTETLPAKDPISLNIQHGLIIGDIKRESLYGNDDARGVRITPSGDIYFYSTYACNLFFNTYKQGSIYGTERFNNRCRIQAYSQYGNFYIRGSLIPDEGGFWNNDDNYRDTIGNKDQRWNEIYGWRGDFSESLIVAGSTVATEASIDVLIKSINDNLKTMGGLA